MLDGILSTMKLLIVFVLGNVFIGFLPVYIIGRIQFMRWPDKYKYKCYIPTYQGSLYGILISLGVGYLWTYQMEWFYYIPPNWKILIYFFGVTSSYLVAQLYFSKGYRLETEG